MRTHLVFLVGALMFVAACDQPAEGIITLEESFRRQASAQPRAGTLRALEVGVSAHAVARSIVSSAGSECPFELPGDGAFTYRLTLELRRESAAGVEARWSEGRTLRRDDDGNLAVSMDAEFRTELRDAGERSLRWHLVGQDSYVSVGGEAFYRHDASAGERGRLMAAGSASLQALLDAASSGWARSEADAEHVDVYKLGGERLTCGSGSKDEVNAGWLRRFRGRAALLSGRLRVSEQGTQRLDVRWQLEDGSTLDAHLEGRLEDGAEPIEVPDPASVVAIERDRSLRQLERSLQTMNDNGFIGAAARSNSTEARP